MMKAVTMVKMVTEVAMVKIVTVVVTMFNMA